MTKAELAAYTKGVQTGYDRALLGIPLYVEEVNLTFAQRQEAARKRAAGAAKCETRAN